jgi:hypothetical protein
MKTQINTQKKAVLSMVILLTLTVTSFGQQTSDWENWNWLMGEWIGEGSGQPGNGSGTFTFSPELDRKILVRKSHSEYPATDNKPAVIHEDLLIVYLDENASPSKAIYFDNEGHTINYSITYPENKKIVLTSGKVSDSPVFRLTYTMDDAETVNTKFEISRDGSNFMTYIEGRSKKVK